jgi:hypothetical protein
MSKLIGAVLSLVMVGCGQAAPDSEVGSNAGSQREIAGAHRDTPSGSAKELAAASDPSQLSAQGLAAASDPSQLPVQESAASGAPALAAAPISSSFRCLPTPPPQGEATVAGLAPLDTSANRPRPQKPGPVARLPLRPEVNEVPPDQAAPSAPPAAD